MTAVWPTTEQIELMTDWGADNYWMSEGAIGLFGDVEEDKAYFYGEIDNLSLYNVRGDSHPLVVLLFRIGTSWKADWHGFRCDMVDAPHRY